MLTSFGPTALAIVACLAAQSGTFDERFDQGVRHARAADFDAALAVLQQALLAPDASLAQQASAWLWLGRVRAERSESDAAREAFAKALALDDAVELDSPVSPKIRRLLEEVRAAHTPPLSDEPMLDIPVGGADVVPADEKVPVVFWSGLGALGFGGATLVTGLGLYIAHVVVGINGQPRPCTTTAELELPPESRDCEGQQEAYRRITSEGEQTAATMDALYLGAVVLEGVAMVSLLSGAALLGVSALLEE